VDPAVEFMVCRASISLVPPRPAHAPSSRYGIDGKWSNFQFQLGSPLQTVYLTPATTLSEIWAVQNHGCTQGESSQFLSVVLLLTRTQSPTLLHCQRWRV